MRESLESRRWIGRVLRDKWRIDARISRGGVGTVYAATHKNNGSRAAIKVLHPEFSRDADTRSRFLQEGYAANQVNHPGVVRILDDDTSEDGHAYLVMELLEGELLETRRVRKGGRLPIHDVYEVGEQLLDVLAAAHDKGIVHRDIKPDNLFVTQEGRLKVLDFGFAQMRSSFRTEQTATGFLLGTPGFMSPEQAVGNRPQIDAKTDIWAAGATLFTLLSGEPVHAGESAAEMLVAAANFQPRSLASVTTGLNPRLVQLVDRAVAFDKANRWPNARAMQLALREVSGKQSAGAVSRRSIPDDGPTLYESPTEIEELDEDELVDAKNSWPPGNERTVVAKAEITDEAVPSAMTRQVPRPTPRRPSRHPADDDGPTVAVGGGTTDPSELAPRTQPPATQPPRTQPPATQPPHTQPPQTPQMARYPSAVPAPRTSPPAANQGGMVDASIDGGTLIMESPARDDSGSGASYPPLGPSLVRPKTAPKPFGRSELPPQAFRPPAPPGPSLSQGPPAQGPHAQGPANGNEELLYVAGPANRALRGHEPQGSRVLVFVAVAVCTMLVVIVAGLVFLSASD